MHEIIVTKTTPERSQLLTALRDAPNRLAEIARAAPAAAFRRPPAAGEWSANEILAHLRACGDVWGDGIARMLDEDGCTFRAVNPRTWIEHTGYRNQDFRASLRAYTKQRRELVATLERLTPRDWSRKAVVTGAGKPLERTVLFYAQWLMTHERPHLKQIARATAAGGR